MYVLLWYVLRSYRQDECTSLLNDRIASQSGLYFISDQAYLKGNMLTIVFAGIILIVLCIWMAWKRFEFSHIMSAVPGPKAWPIVGNALQLKRDPHGTRYLECITRILSLHLKFSAYC